jgi:hypothetical protein
MQIFTNNKEIGSLFDKKGVLVIGPPFTMMDDETVAIWCPVEGLPEFFKDRCPEDYAIIEGDIVKDFGLKLDNPKIVDRIKRLREGEKDEA